MYAANDKGESPNLGRFRGWLAWQINAGGHVHVHVGHTACFWTISDLCAFRRGGRPAIASLTENT